jgi:ADP-ribosyl-[dinitrogen reductase] hydrolase
MTANTLDRSHTPTTTELHRGTGALLGSAIGDALGAPFEFGPAGQYTARFPQPVLGGTGEMCGGGSFGWQPGEFTDDTQMALCLAESLCAQHGIDPADLWQRWRAWASLATDVGIITSAALAHPEHTGAAARAHQSLGRSAGNGALMRVTPVALAFVGAAPHHATELTMAAAVAQAALTHHDPAAGWGAAVAAELVRRAILGLNPVAQVPEVLGFVPAEVAARFAPMLAPEWQPGSTDEPGNGSVWGCLAQAVWAVRHHASFHDAVVAAIDLGGDTDTVACVTGALAGARNGIQAIPSRFTTYVHGHVATPSGTRRYDNAALQALARQLMGADNAAPPPAESPAGPQRIMPGVWAADLSAAAAHGHEYAVLSLCRTEGAFAHVPVRREVYLVDKEGPQNPDLGTAVRDAVDTVEAWLAEGREVLVHCHGGRSRTALVLKAVAMRQRGLSADEAHEWLTAQWHRYDPWNRTFAHFLATEWGS